MKQIWQLVDISGLWMEAVTVKQLTIWAETLLQLKRETWVLLTSIFHLFYSSSDGYFLQYQAKA